MDLQPGFSDELIELIKTVSDPLSPRTESLLREDSDSLVQYLASEAFLQDLLALEDPLRIDSDVFFFILLYQLKRKFSKSQEFRDEFFNSLASTTDRSWSKSAIESFLQDQRLIIYLVNMLDGFVETERLHQIPSLDDEKFHYVYEMIEASRTSSESESYRIFCHIGNYSLYLTGIFPEWIRYRHERKNRPMDVDAYSDYGKTYFSKAASHRMARERHTESVLNKLSKGYDLVRTSLEMLFGRILASF